MTKQLTGKTVLVTGGCGYLGSALCERLAKVGANIGILESNLNDFTNTCSELAKEHSVKIKALEADISKTAKLSDAIDSLESEIGPIDTAVNNAATKTNDFSKFFTHWFEYPKDIWDEVLGVNLSAAFFVSQQIARRLVSRKQHGSLLFISSIYGISGPDPQIYEGALLGEVPINTPPIYAASKAGIIGLSRYFATTLGPYGIRSNSITLGGVEANQNDKFKGNYGKHVPLGRMATRNEVIDPMIFLISPSASYINGANIIVDGGLTARC